MSPLEFAAWAAVVATALTLGLLLPFALHRLLLLRAARRAGVSAAGRPVARPGTGAAEAGLSPSPVGPDGPAESWPGELPAVTVQLPIYNEAGVVERLLDAVAALQYPAHRLDVQVLDDSTDETSQRVARKIEMLQARGLRIEHLRRDSREGFKAGALEAGRRAAEGQFLLILDADFVPQPELILGLLSPFADPEVGMVQARWDHLNEDESLLTRAQAVLLDGHFFFEQGGRHAAGRFMSFNGTAGMWRAEALDDAGGWSSATLTEDLDVSYRAQMAGWRFVFLAGLGVPAELPSSVPALELQQQRWAQGGIQTARRLLGRLWRRGSWSFGVRVEGTIHLLGHLAHPLTVMLGVLLLPSALGRRYLGLDHLLVLDLVIFTMATVSFLLFYASAGRCRGRPWRRVVPSALLTLSLGIGLTAPVSRSVLRGLRGSARDPFRRTPKTGRVTEAGASAMHPGTRQPESRQSESRQLESLHSEAWHHAERDRSPRDHRRSAHQATAPSGGGSSPPARGIRSGVLEQRLKLGLTLWMALCVVVALASGLYGTVPLLLLFGSGWGWLAWGGRAMPDPPARRASTPTQAQLADPIGSR
ncbi:MAG: glycosyltransferase [Gemmatimonadales bacterium]|nr:MAG: glycosyltransferase [Gemmatimonadales bacterium]